MEISDNFNYSDLKFLCNALMRVREEGEKKSSAVIRYYRRFASGFK